jgi:uncharacterized lipoprotein YehR (DUF1307 family)
MKKKNIILFLIISSFIFTLTSCGDGSDFIGYWKNEDDYVKVEKNGDNYTWIDEDGEYPATMEDEKLIVDGGGIEATVTYNKDDDVLLFSLFGDQDRYEKITEEEYEENFSPEE